MLVFPFFSRFESMIVALYVFSKSKGLSAQGKEKRTRKTALKALLSRYK